MIKIELNMEMPENCMECRFHEVDGLFDRGERMTDESMSYLDALKEIKRLKEVLDEIRAEVQGKIIKRPKMDFKYWEREHNEALLDVLDIIDKHISKLRDDTK